MKPQIAKLTRPRLTGIVERHRLLDHLDRISKTKIIWISAPAGSGKTTLVANWLDARKLSCLWYQADEGDADIATFFSYMGKAVIHAAPRYRRPLPLFTPEYLLGIPTFTKRFFESLFSRLISSRPALAKGRRGGYVVVIDNYQDVPADSPFHEVVRDGLSVVPHGLTIVVVSRSDPPPAFSRLHANGQLAVLGWDTMRFTLEESRLLVASRGKQRPDNDLLKALYRMTEGWAAGMVLLTQSVATRDDLPELWEIPPGRVFDYFATELFGRTDDETRNFLMMTAFLPSMTTRMAEDLTGNSHADQILSRLSRANFFTEKHATPMLSYTYHPLFREFLLSRAHEALGLDETNKIKKKAALLLVASDQMESAFELLSGTGSWDDSIQLILTHARSFAGQGRFKTLMKWIERIPKSSRENQPWLVFWLGVCKKPINPPQARALFERAHYLFQNQGDVTCSLLAWSEIVDTFLYEWNDFHPLDRWIAWLDGRMEQDPSFPSREIEARVASCMVDALVFRRPDHPEVRRWVDRARNLSDEISDAGMRLQAYLHIINYDLWMGDHPNCLRIAEKIRNIVLSPAATPIMSIIHHWLEAGTNCIVLADFDKALSHVAEGIERGEKDGIHVWDHMLMTFGAFSALNKGDIAVASDYLKRMEMSVSGQFHNIVGMYHVSAWRSFLLGDYVQAAITGEKVYSEVCNLGMALHITLYNIILANIYLMSGEYHKAAERLAQAHESVQSSGSLMLEYTYLLTKAYSVLHRGETTEAKEILRNAMALGRSRGYVSSGFWWDPRATTELCMKALEEGIEVEYVRSLIRKRNLTPPCAKTESDRQSAICNLQLEAWPWPVKIYTLGRFEMFKDDEPLIFSGRVQQKPLSLLKAIVASNGKDVSEERLTDELWPDSDGDIAKKSFDTTLHRLRKLVNHDNAIVLREGRVSLDERYCWVDTRAFERALCSAEEAWKREGEEQEQDDAVRLTEKAIPIYKGHFLPGDAKEPWTVSLRERLRAKFMHSINILGRHWMETGRYDKAVPVFRNGLEIDDLAEEFYQQLMVCYHQLGQQTAAVRVYHRCRSVLQSSLGLNPSSKTEGIYYALRQRK